MNAAKEPELWTELLRLGAAFGRRMLEENDGPPSPRGHRAPSARAASYAPSGAPAAPYPHTLTAQPCLLPRGTPAPLELEAPRPGTEAVRLHTTHAVSPSAASVASAADRDGPTSPGGAAYGPVRRRSRGLRWQPSALPQRSEAPPTPHARPLRFEDLCARVRAL